MTVAERRTVRTNGSVRNTEYITDGNTVRVVRRSADPFYEQEMRRKLVLERQQKRQRELASQAQRRQSLSIAFPVLVMLSLLVTAMLYFGYQYLSLQSSVDTHMANVRNLETQLEDLKVENDALEQSIETNVDLNYVYDVAINKLGMVHAGAENVIRYDKTESQYVRQYEQIPEF